MQHFSSSLYILLCLGTGAGHDIWRLLDPATLGYYLLAYVPPYFLIYRLCARPLGQDGSYRASLFRAGGITVLVLPVALFLSLVAKLSGGGGVAFLAVSYTHLDVYKRQIEYKTIELTNADQESTWSAVWSKVLVNVPVYEYNDANENGIQDAGEKITAYYVYTAEAVSYTHLDVYKRQT